MKFEIKGEKELKAAFESLIKTTAKETRTAMLEAGLIVEQAAFKKTPKDTGNLRNSYRVFGDDRSVTIQNHAEYAAAVHEMPGTLSGEPRKGGKGNYWDSGEPKFLEKALNENEAKVQELILNGLIKSIARGGR